MCCQALLSSFVSDSTPDGEGAFIVNKGTRSSRLVRRRKVIMITRGIGFRLTGALILSLVVRIVFFPDCPDHVDDKFENLSPSVQDCIDMRLQRQSSLIVPNYFEFIGSGLR